MHINTISLTEILLMIEIKHLGVTFADNFENTWTEDELYTALYKYYQKEFPHTKITIKDNHILFTWLKDKERYSLLNILLKMQINRLMDTGHLMDPFIVNNINALLEVMINFIDSWSIEPKKDITLSTMDLPSIHRLVQEFLTTVDPSLEWLNLYNDMLNNNKLLVLNDKQSLKQFMESESACFHSNGNPFIAIELKQNIEDFIAIVHEFMHYISFYNHSRLDISNTLLEASPIFYEYYSLLFLEQKGFNKDIIQHIKTDRMANTYHLSLHIYDLCNYLKEFIHNEGIVKPKNDNHQTCDRCITQMIVHPDSFFTCYPYIIGNYLALKGIEQIKKGNNILPSMKQMTDDLYAISPNIFFKTVGCDIENKQYQKTVH